METRDSLWKCSLIGQRSQVGMTNLLFYAKLQCFRKVWRQNIEYFISTSSINHLFQTSSFLYFCCYYNYYLIIFLFPSIRSSQPSVATHSTSEWCYVLLIYMDISSIHHNVTCSDKAFKSLIIQRKEWNTSLSFFDRCFWTSLLCSRRLLVLDGAKRWDI